MIIIPNIFAMMQLSKWGLLIVAKVEFILLDLPQKKRFRNEPLFFYAIYF